MKRLFYTEGNDLVMRKSSAEGYMKVVMRLPQLGINEENAANCQYSCERSEQDLPLENIKKLPGAKSQDPISGMTLCCGEKSLLVRTRDPFTYSL